MSTIRLLLLTALLVLPVALQRSSSDLKQYLYNIVNQKIIKISGHQNHKLAEAIINNIQPEHYDIVVQMAWVESKFQPDAVSKTGDHGILQICEKYHKFDKLKIYDINYNIRLGYSIFKQCLNESRGDVRKALGRYNGSKQYPRRYKLEGI